MADINFETIELNPGDASVTLPENRPFRIGPDKTGGRVGMLLVHGFTGTPWEMREVGQALAADDTCILAVRLPGHGTSAEDLAERDYEEWLSAVDSGHRYLADRCEHVVGVGLSTGALLLLAAAETLPFSSLVLLSPYLKMRQILAPLAGVLRHFIKFHRRPIDSDWPPYYYQDRPIAGVYQINRLIRRVKKILPGIACPALVASAEGDTTVQSESAISLYNKLGSSKKEYYRFGSEVPHVLTTADNPKLDDMLRIISRFTGTLATS